MCSSSSTSLDLDLCDLIRLFGSMISYHAGATCQTYCLNKQCLGTVSVTNQRKRISPYSSGQSVTLTEGIGSLMLNQSSAGKFKIEYFVS